MSITVNARSEAIVPNELLYVDPRKETRSIFVDPAGSVFEGGHVGGSFAQVDELYTADRLGYFRRIAGGVSHEKRRRGVLDTAFLYDEATVRSPDITVVFSPLNDGRPMSTPEDIHHYVSGEHTAHDKKKAQPNSWGPLTKLAISHDFAAAEGFGTPHLQLFAPEVPALSREERRQIAQGITLPYSRLAIEALHEADMTRRALTGKGFERVHLFCAGMGSKALGAAAGLLKSDYNVASVTVQNLSIGKTTPFELQGKYAARLMIGDASSQRLPTGYEPIFEPLIRREVDGYGAENAMRLRQAAALWHWRVVMGVMGTEQPARDVETLLEHGVTVTVANAHNEAMNDQTERYLPLGADRFHYADILGVNGQKTGQAENEHATVVAYVESLGKRNWRRDKFLPAA